MTKQNFGRICDMIDRAEPVKDITSVCGVAPHTVHVYRRLITKAKYKGEGEVIIDPYPAEGVKKRIIDRYCGRYHKEMERFDLMKELDRIQEAIDRIRRNI